jgi:hypothetical protein
MVWGGVVVGEWRTLDSRTVPALVEARLELHHAAQLAAAVGVSYLPKCDDDSHTNLQWIESANALSSRPVAGTTAVRIAVRPHPFSLLVLDADGAERATFALSGRTMIDATQWVRDQLAARGVNAGRYTLAKHYTIPPHAIEDGAPFGEAKAAALEQLGDWFSNAATTLSALALETPNASEVRCWPHHFDLATLITLVPGRSIGVGMEPGDEWYAEPYFYVNAYPAPADIAGLPTLGGGGAWQTRGWIGAVLPGSRLGRVDQQSQVTDFIASAVAASTAILH